MDSDVLAYYVVTAAPERSVSGHYSCSPVKDKMKKRISGSRTIYLFRSKGNQRGFTLTELLIVLSVFVALLALTLPDYLKNRPQRLLNGETNRLSATIRSGRLIALRDNQKAYLEFIPEIDMYRLWSEQGWRAYSDVINGPGDPPGRNPEIGDYDGDFDGDGDFWWGTGGTPDAPVGNPEDPNVNGWMYDLTDWNGTYTDPDVLLMPSYPGNKPVRTMSPQMRINIDQATGFITGIYRDFEESAGVAGDTKISHDVDIRMRNVSTNWNPSAPIGKRNGVLSHFPLIFMVFFPNGSINASWDRNNPTGFSDEIIDMRPGGLGAAQIYLQTRSPEYNLESWNLFDPTIVVEGDEGPGEPLSPYTSLSLDASNTDLNGRVITVNNLTGRVIIKNFAPYDLDKLRQDPPPNIDYF